MKRGKRISLTLLICMSMLFLIMPQDVAAVSLKFSVSINDASYNDLDNDAVEDDVLIIFSCEIMDGIKSPSRTDFFFTLTLPSGHQHYALVIVIGRYRQISIGLNWFDSAWEPGWYNVQVEAYAYGIRGGYAYDTYDFDPPTGSGTGDPSITAYLIEM